MAPKRLGKTTGKLVQEIPKEDDITEVQVPRLVQFPGTADRLALGLSKPDEVFNFWLTGLLTALAKWKWISTFRLAAVQPQRGTPAPPRLQQLLHSINHTPPLAVQLNGCACEGLCSGKSPPLLDYLSNHPEDEIYCNVDHIKSLLLQRRQHWWTLL